MLILYIMDTDVYYVLHGFRIKDKTFEVNARVLFSFHANVCPINYFVIRACTDLTDHFVIFCFPFHSSSQRILVIYGKIRSIYVRTKR